MRSFEPITHRPVRRLLVPLSLLAALAAAAPACGDDDDDGPPGSSGRSGGAGAGGTAGQGGNAGENGGGQGGAAGESGGGGQGGAGGAGGGAGACLEPSTFAALLALDATLPLCVTRAHPFALPAGFSEYNAPTWGRHGGPLVLAPSAAATSLTFSRWTLPASPTAPAERSDETAAGLAPPGGTTFWGPAVDLPFGDWTLVSYTTSTPNAAGEVLLLDSATRAVEHRHAANGFYAAFGLADGAGGGHLFFTGLSPLSAAPAATVDSAVYAARTCAQGFAGAGCEAGRKVADWESSSGPAAVDADGRGFFALSTFGGDLQVRGFARAALVAADAGEGVTFVQTQNYAQSLAALAPAGASPGFLFVDEAADAGQRIGAVAYASGAAGEPVKGEAVASAVTPAAGATARVFGAGGDEVWVSVVAGGAGHFLALRRAPAR